MKLPCLVAAIAFVIPAVLWGQAGSVAGRATMSTTGEPLELVRVELRRSNGSVAGRAVTDPHGQFRAAGVAPATYTLVAMLQGFREAVTSVTVRADSTLTVNLALQPARTILTPTSITSSRREEKALNAPASISIVSNEEILEHPVTALTDHLRMFPGADVASGSLLQVTSVTRGFSNVFSGRMLTLVDSRAASVPSLGVNAPYLVPTIAEDVDRIELLLGPAAALYGPNAADGVLHIITKSPFESQGSTLTIENGERQFFRGALRHSFTVGDRWAAKISGEWVRAHDWESVDAEEAALIAQRPGARERDFQLRRLAGEARVDFRPVAGAELTATYGRASVSSLIEPTATSGAALADGWNYETFRLSGTLHRLFGQVFLNRSDAGNTILLRSGLPIIDRSYELAAQLQHSLDVAERLRLVYGADFVRTNPVTDGSINGRFEDDDVVNEVGAYLHTVTQLSRKVELVASGRLDRNSELLKAVFSPRATVVFKPQPSQNIRVSYGRAFATPTNFDLFLDQNVQAMGPYQLHAMGVPATGYQFRRDCAGGEGSLCMHSPFTAASAGGPAQWLPASATPFWQDAIGAALADPGAAGLRPLEAAFRSMAPGAADVMSTLALLNTGARTFDAISPDLVRDLPRLRPTLSAIYEIGYKGLWDQLQIGVNLWYLQRRDFIGAASAESPSVFLDSLSLAAYLEEELRDRGVANPEAVAVQAARAFASVPVGTVLMDHPFVAPTDIVLTFRNYGRVSNSGADLVGEYLLSDRVSLAGTYSHVMRGQFSRAQTGSPNEIFLNAPRHKGSFSVRYHEAGSSFSAEVRGRFTGGFDVRSGVYSDHIRAYALADARLAWRSVLSRGSVLSISASNIFDDRHREFAGGAPLGRLVMTRIQFAF